MPAVLVVTADGIPGACLLKRSALACCSVLASWLLSLWILRSDPLGHQLATHTRQLLRCHPPDTPLHAGCVQCQLGKTLAALVAAITCAFGEQPQGSVWSMLLRQVRMLGRRDSWLVPCQRCSRALPLLPPPLLLVLVLGWELSSTPPHGLLCQAADQPAAQPSQALLPPADHRPPACWA